MSKAEHAALIEEDEFDSEQDQKDMDDAMLRIMREEAGLGPEDDSSDEEDIAEEAEQEAEGEGAQGTEATAADEPQREEVLDGYTKDELREILGSVPQLQKTIDTMNGTYGQQLESLKRALAAKQQTEQAETEEEDAEFKPEDFAQTFEAFPEVAETLAADLYKLMQRKGKAKTQEIDPTNLKAEITESVDAKLEADKEERAREKAIEDLTELHPDWQEVALFDFTEKGLVKWADPKFGVWVAEQDEDTQKTILEGVDAVKVSGVISAYKEGNVQAKPKPKTTSRKVNLSKAVLPRNKTQKGTSTAVLSDDEIIEQSMRKTMKEMSRGY
jgi:hypothetical protein